MYILTKLKRSFFILSLLVVASCSHETDNFDGPNLVDRFGPFNVVTDLDVSQPTVDFAAGETVFFTAEFNKNIAWVLEITGRESGAVKRIEGFDKSVNASNALWNGGTTVLPLFRSEICDVVLTIPEVPEYMGSATVETLSSRSYANEGVLFTDFEMNFGPEVFVGNFEFEFTPQTGRRDDIPAEGNNYFLLQGTDNVVPNFFVGLVDISSEVTGNTYVQVPTTVPEDLYFNCFMYSSGGPHGIGIIDFIVDSNDSGAFEDGQDATYRVADYNLATWDGWQQVSHPMSDTGISQAELEKLVGIRLLLISDMNAQPNPPLQVEYGIDFMIFTGGGPLEL